MSDPVVAIVDTGGANLTSVSNALDRLGRAWTLTRDPARVAAADRVILPGVGAAHDSMERLRAARLVDAIRSRQKPTLGICVGMQLLFERSEEGDTACLGVIPGAVTRMSPAPGLRVPHMGWNRVEPLAGRGPWAGLPSPAYFYFVHSFAAPMGDWVCATVTHGATIPAAVRRGPFVGCQFHPERSASVGASFLANFLMP